MNKNMLKDRIMLACRALKDRQPLPQMPQKIPAEKLPPADLNEALAKFKAKEKQKKARKLRDNESSSRSALHRDKSEAKSSARNKKKSSSKAKKNGSSRRHLNESSVSQISSSVLHQRVAKMNNTDDKD